VDVKPAIPIVMGASAKETMVLVTDVPMFAPITIGIAGLTSTTER